MKFEDLNLDRNMLEAIRSRGFEEPTLIQKDSIPLILEGKDVIGKSATGSGKTLAFAAGLIRNSIPKQGIQGIVLVPTRELAEQVKEEIFNLNNKGLKVMAIYGGVSIEPQIKGLKRADIVVSTPGRLLDHIQRRTINLTRIKVLVIDEADRMVDMGFIEDVERIINELPTKRQTLLFSATINEETEHIANKYMKKPITIHATEMVDPNKLKQVYYDVPGKLKKELLTHLLKKEKSKLSLVFCNTRRATEFVAERLKKHNINVGVIHGGMTQNKRLKTIERFHKKHFNVLVCTDVVARGIHINGITHVYNFDLPKDPKDYIHRIGRTARAGKTGHVVNLLSNRDHESFSRIVHKHRFNIEKQERPYLKASDNDEYNKSKINHRNRNYNDFNNDENYNRFNNRSRMNSNPRSKSRFGRSRRSNYFRN